ICLFLFRIFYGGCLRLYCMGINDLYGNGKPVFQMAVHLFFQFFSVFLEQSFVRRIYGKGYLPSFRQKSHFDRSVDQFVCNLCLVFSPALIAFQKKLSVFIEPFQIQDLSYTVKLHPDLRINGKINRRIGDQMVLIISCSENQQEAGGYSSPASGDPSCRPESPGRPFFHKDRITDLLPYLVVEIGCFQKTSLLVKKN